MEPASVILGDRTLPPEPDRAWVDAWLHQVHLAYWAATEQ